MQITESAEILEFLPNFTTSFGFQPFGVWKIRRSRSEWSEMELGRPKKLPRLEPSGGN
jgi:hypothetical protein